MKIRILVLIVLIIGFIIAVIIKNEDLATAFNLLIFCSFFELVYKIQS